MANHAQSNPPIRDKEIEVPEWEHESATNNHGATTQSHGSNGNSIREKLDATMPPHRKYLGMRRNIFLAVLLASILALLALIIGLSVGLTQKSKHKNLPLPSNAQTFSGDLTYYAPGLGACGMTNTDSDNIVSVSHYLFDAAGSSSSTGGNSNANPLCGLFLRAQRFDEDRGEMRSVDLKVVDRCTGCEPDDLDVTISAFEKLASSEKGRVNVNWAWLDSESSD